MTGSLPHLLPPFTLPLGVLPWPMGLLVLPEVDGAEPVADSLCRGELPASWPAGLAFCEAALDGDLQRAAGLLDPADPVTPYNAAVLVGDGRQWAALGEPAAAPDAADLAALAATARFSLGLLDAPPEAAGLRGEVAALVLSAQASAAMERGDLETSVVSLRRAVDAARQVDSPLLAASLSASLAELLREGGSDPAGAVEVASSALTSLGQLAPVEAVSERRADLLLTRGLALAELAESQPPLALDVVRDLQEALTVFTEETHPERFAECSVHLALAYLVLPTSDQGDRIRAGVAVNALRGALRVYDRRTHPVAWAHTTLNLANALQYLPSAFPEQHLTEAVDLYEQVLQVRDEHSDPVGVARTLANQANALAHLGAFADAGERLTRAEQLFSAAGDQVGLSQVSEIRAEIDQCASAAEREA